jgi:hypothetical protein
MAFTPNQRARLQARSGCAQETIKRYPHVTEASRLRIERAAREESIDLSAAPAPVTEGARNV